MLPMTKLFFHRANSGDFKSTAAPYTLDVITQIIWVIGLVTATAISGVIIYVYLITKWHADNSRSGKGETRRR